MRIELPSGSWDATALRVDDDAHTLTLVPQAQERTLPPDSDGPARTLRVDVAGTAPRPLTLTL